MLYLDTSALVKKYFDERNRLGQFNPRVNDAMTMFEKRTYLWFLKNS